jgi:hypothetical protein
MVSVFLLFASTSFATENPTNVFAGYAGPESCKGCHPVEYQRWSQSAHGLAESSRTATMQTAFNPARAIHHGYETAGGCAGWRDSTKPASLARW